MPSQKFSMLLLLHTSARSTLVTALTAFTSFVFGSEEKV